MKSRIASILTVVLLLAGTGGAIAVGESVSHSSAQGGAASGQYKPGKGCGDKNHQHKKKNQCKAPKKHKKAKKHHKSTTKHKSTKKSTSKKSGSGSKCTVRTQHGVTVLFCP